MKSACRLFIVLVLMAGCSAHSHKKVVRGFYYWKTEFRLTPAYKDILSKLHIKKLYIRFFDVSLPRRDSIPQPVQPLVFKDRVPDNIDVVPVIFITNETLQKIDSNDIPRLAESIAGMTEQMVKIYLQHNINEIQLDCDWSASTRKKYFSLLRCIRPVANKNHWILSATIRLFQEKYPRIAGVPPVDRGTLMVYNMLPITDFKVKNSIIEMNEERKYLSALDKYPLKLDVVLPIFYWGVVFRNGTFAGIMNNLTEHDLGRNASFQHVSGVLYEAMQDMNFGGAYVEKGDIIRLESCSDKVMQSSIDLLASKNRTDTLCISFFSLDSLLVNHAGYEKMENYYSLYR